MEPLAALFLILLVALGCWGLAKRMRGRTFGLGPPSGWGGGDPSGDREPRHPSPTPAAGAAAVPEPAQID